MYIATYCDKAGGRGDATEAIPVAYGQSLIEVTQQVHRLARKMLDSHLVRQTVNRNEADDMMIPHTLRGITSVEAVYLVHDDEMDMPYADIVIYNDNP